MWPFKHKKQEECKPVIDVPVPKYRVEARQFVDVILGRSSDGYHPARTARVQMTAAEARAFASELNDAAYDIEQGTK